MKTAPKTRLQALVFFWILPGVVLSGITWVCFRHGIRLEATAFAYRIVIVLLALVQSYIASIIFSVVAVACLDFFFTKPLFALGENSTGDALSLATFLVTSLIIIALIISARKLREVSRERARLQQESSLLREQARLLDLTHDTILVRDMNNRITYWNRGAEELYGWKKEEVIGETPLQLLQTRFPVDLDEINSTVLRTGRWEGEVIQTKRDGSEVVVASRWCLQKDEDGQPFATLETNNDITARKRAEEWLHRSQAAYLAEAQKLSLTGSFGWNTANDELFFSEQSFLIFDYDQTLKPSVDLVLQRTHPDDLELVKQVIARARTGHDFDFEHRLLMPDGTVKHLHIVAHVVQQCADNPEFVGAIMDVTASRRAEEQLREARIQLAHITRVTTLGELTASIAHEVNQPLNAIVISGGACLRWLGHSTPRPDEVRACVEQMVAAGQRAGEIVMRIRAFTKRARPQKTLLNLNDLINDIVSLVRHDIVCHRVSLRLELASRLPPLLGDKIELQQVIINLVMNGVQAMDGVSDSPRELLIESRRSEDDQHIIVSIRDSGAGIDAKNAARLFEPFFTTKCEGMGMGLSICRSILEAHGGRVWGFNNADRGATFQFTLPAIVSTPGDGAARVESLEQTLLKS